ncbi:MAG: ClpXP protease specificity-enhancing factor SspB [Ancalomicrobiaceae bacterium]|nr:ClpXP protease specificity-enhancing factor SspB [Ancalomicrobiaceae bacterium]
MTQDLIRYDVLVQDALRGVVRKIVAEIARTGLPGQHHFFIAFDTKHPGVRMSNRLRQRYPDEMTVVLQHQFWDLNVSDHAFEVGLSFSGIPERLLVPFNAIKGFFDPSVQFGLQFEVVAEADATVAEDDAVPAPFALVEPAEEPQKPEASPLPFATRPTGSEPDARGEPKSEDAAEPKRKPALRAVPNEPEAGATIVSLDTFRKKT